ncbi:MAG: DUF4199 domain-containing protein [Opitutus sp.]
MKTTLSYGFAMALAGGVVTLALYFLGYHTDPEKFSTSQWIGLPLYLAITVVLLVLGTRARRDEVPASEEFGYGRALWAGVQIVFFGALFGAVINFAYVQFINTDFADVVVQSQAAKLEEKGMGATQVEQMERMTRTMMKPGVFAFVTFIQAALSGVVIALITSAFARRTATTEPPALA